MHAVMRKGRGKQSKAKSDRTGRVAGSRNDSGAVSGFPTDDIPISYMGRATLQKWGLTDTQHRYNPILARVERAVGNDSIVQRCAATEGGNQKLAESSRGKSSGSLDWDAVVSKKGETRKAHVALHQKNDLGKPLHGVFKESAVSTINEAWANRESARVTHEGTTDLYVIPYKNAGTEGGANGSGEELHHVTIVTQHETNNIITGYPSRGPEQTTGGV